MSTWPSNTMQTVNLNGRYGLPGRTRATAAISLGTSRQNEALLPATVNTALVAPVLERSTAEAEAKTLAMVYTVNSRPAEYLWLNAKYRYYNYDTRTPQFDISSMVVADNTLGAAKESEPLDIKRQTLDLDASYTPFQYASLNMASRARTRIAHSGSTRKRRRTSSAPRLTAPEISTSQCER